MLLAAQISQSTIRFLSQQQPRHAPARRICISFPNITLQLLKLTPEQVEQVRQTGWLREVAFKTTPNVTKVCERRRRRRV